MIGVSDFNGHYEWAFAWLQRQGGRELLRQYWDEAIHGDAQRHAARLIQSKGIQGMKEYWGQTLAAEGGTHYTTATESVFRLDMHDCPSKGFLVRNHLRQHEDYCDHCMGWIGPMLLRAGFVVDHQHNHAGQCWWEMRRNSDTGPPSRPGELSGQHDVRHLAKWAQPDQTTDTFVRANSPEQKQSGS